VRYGYQLVTDCLKANQGKKPHKDVEATIIHYFNTYTNITATERKPFPDGKQADRHPHLRRDHHRQPCGPELAPRRHVNQPYGGRQANQEFINRAALGHQPGPEEHDPRNDVLTSAKRSANTPSTTASARQRGLSSHLSRSKRRAVTVPPPRRCTSSSPSKCATRACRRTCSWARHLFRASPGHDRPSDYTCPRRLRPPSAPPRMSLPSTRRAGIARQTPLLPSIYTRRIDLFLPIVEAPQACFLSQEARKEIQGLVD
jgi:hypothetical protein